MKIQYPGVAEAVETDLRNATLLLPLVKRLAPGPGREGAGGGDARADRRRARLRARGPEPAPHRATDARTSVHARPPRRTDLSTRRVLVSEYVAGERFRGRPPGRRGRSATGTARSSSGSSSACSIAIGSPSAIRIPATTCCCPTAASASWTSDSCVTSTPRACRRNGRLRSPSAIAMPAGLKAALIAAGYLPADRADAVDADWALGLMRMAIKWYAVPGERRFPPDRRSPRPRRASAPRRRAARGDADAGESVHDAARGDPDPADARHRRGRARPAPGRRGLGRDRRGVPARRRRPRRHWDGPRPTSSLAGVARAASGPKRPGDMPALRRGYQVRIG